MNQLRLVEPDHTFEAAYRAAMADWLASEENLTPLSLTYDLNDFQALLQHLADEKQGINLQPGFVPTTNWWVLDEAGQMVGACCFRHQLNDFLVNVGGHIAYGIRPGFRNRGYARQVLRLVLEQARIRGYERVLLTVEKENEASKRVILACDGVLENEYPVDIVPLDIHWIECRYWITL